MKKLSFIIPVYNSEKTIAEVVHEIMECVESLEYEYEIILVNDKSQDGSEKICKGLSQSFDQVKVFSLTRNFGQACALMAGLGQSEGDYILCLDDDLQTPPSEFPKLLNTLLAGNYDLVYGYYEHKEHNKFRNFGSLFNKIMQHRVIKMPKELHTSSYFAARKEIVEAVIGYDQPYPYLPGLFYRVTHNICSIPIRHQPRKAGKSGYTFKKLLKLWENGLINFSYIPLKIPLIFGASFLIVFLVLFLAVVILNLWSNLLLLIFLFMSLSNGIQFLSIGFMGEYIGRMFMGINGAPQYVIRKNKE